MGKRAVRSKKPHRPIYASIEDAWRFITARPKKITESGCWEWLGAKRSGRGIMNVAGQTQYVYRIAAAVVLGLDLSSPLVACHRCDNPACFNPKHLFVGTQHDNVRDMVTKGRRRTTPQRGEANASAVLTATDVRAIRSARRSGALLSALSLQYGVSETQISRISRYQSWKHLEDVHERA